MNIQEYLETFADEREQPLERMVSDGGFCGIFRTVGCVGDSLSSGEHEAYDEDGKIQYIDLYDYSWGQYLARMAGCKVYNFSKGGMTAREYIKSFADQQDYWNPEKACQAYILALGANDVVYSGIHSDMGTVADVCMEDWKQNKHSFAGYYAMIIQRLKEIQPDAKFFLMTMPRQSDDSGERAARRDAHAALLHEFAGLFDNTYVLDLRKYAPVYDAGFMHRFYLGGHMNACGYLFTAQVVTSYIDYIIRHNPADFREIGFVGTPYRHTRPKP